MPIKKGPDGRKFHMSNTGVDPMVESSESEEGLPSPPPVTTGSVAFSNVLDEVKAGTQNIESTAEARHHNTAAGRNRFGPDLPAQVVIHNWVPETHPAGATGAHATLEECIKQKRDDLLRATVKVCKTGHVVLVVWWTPSDPLNRKGTWSLEVFDCRFELWGEFGIEGHEQCELSTANDIVKTLAKTMFEKWQTVLSANAANPNPICEWNKNKRKLQDDKYNKRSLPSLREIERELRPLAVYALGRVPRGQGRGSRGDRTDKDENGEKQERYKKDQKSTEEELEVKRKAARKKAQLAHITEIVNDQRGRQALDKEHLGKAKILMRDAQRKANGAGGVWDSDGRSFVSRSSIPGASSLDMTEEVEDIPTNPSRIQKAGPKKKPKPKKAVRTEEEDMDLKRIRAAARKDRERQDQGERAEEERQRELAAQQEEVELQERPALADGQDSSSDEDLNAAVIEALKQASPKPEAPQKKPTNRGQEEANGAETTQDSPIDKPELKDRKRRTKTRAALTPVTPDSPDSDSVRPPQLSTLVETKLKSKPKAKPATPKATSKTKKANADGESKTDPTKSAKIKEAKALQGKENKKYKSEKYVADSGLENDQTEDVKLLSDKLQSEEVGVETIEATTTIVHSEHGNDVVEEVGETTTVAVEVQQRDGSVERTEIRKTTTARSNSSEYGEITVEHTTHVKTVDQFDVPYQGFPHYSPPSSPERELQNGFDIPTNALGVEVPITPPPSSPAPSDSSRFSRKRKSPSPDEEPQVDTTAEQKKPPESPAPPSSPKKRKITPPTSLSMEEGAAAIKAPNPPHTENALSSENAASSENTTASPGPAPGDVATSSDLSSSNRAETTAAAAPEATFSPKPATTSPPTSPAESAKSSASLLSSKKRKATWSEEDGEVTISPGGTKRTKRTKRAQFNGVAVSEVTKQEENVDGEGETEISEQVQAEITVVLDDVEKVEVEDDAKSYDSLFHGSSSQEDQDHA
ncbi:hypothetical protein N0V87_004532 [Didymella glomerata]|uniref:Uncharacterized protein n=1 Tax=Didymella glomerata TaxID=749621 RepID=A0A9W9BZQ9_9PLEO|nr:hypothetical protein N0V87_004532 [Didymella glomerata]